MHYLNDIILLKKGYEKYSSITILVILLMAFSHNLFGQNYIQKEYTTHDGLAQVQATDLLQDDNGYIWIATKNGLSQFNGKDFKNFYLPSGEITGIFGLMKSNGDSLFCVIGNKLMSFYKGQFRELLKSKSGEHFSFSGNYILIISKNEIGEWCSKIYTKDLKYLTSICDKELLQNKYDVKNIYFKSKDKFFKYNIDSKSTTLINQITKDEPKKLLIDGLTTLLYNRGNGIIVVIDGQEVATIINNNFTIHTENKVYLNHIEYLKTIFLKTNIIQSGAIDILVDKDKNFWTHTEPGLHFYSKTPFINLPLNPLTDVWAIESDMNKVYVASLSKGFYSFNVDGSGKFTGSINQINNKTNTYYFGASKNFKGQLVFTTNTGFAIYDKGKEIFNKKVEVSMLSVYDSAHQCNYFGHDKALGVLDKNNNYTKIDISKALPNFKGYVVAILQKGSELYLGTYRSTCVYNLENKEFRSLDSIFSDTNKFSISIEKDYHGNLWFGKNGRIYFYDGKSKAKAILEEKISGIVTDIKCFGKYLFIGSASDLTILDLDNYYKGKISYKNYNKNNGFLGEEVAQLGIKKILNTIYIPTSTYTTTLTLDDVNFEEQFLGLKVIEINSSIIDDNKIVKIDKNNATFMYEAIGFNRPTHAEYRFRSAGEAWSSWSRDNICHISELAEGENTIEFQTKLASNNLITKSLNVNVVLPFMKSNNFLYLVFGLGSMMFLGLVFLFGNNFVLQKKRTYDNRQLAYLRARSLQSQMNPHFVFNVLGAIQNPILKGEKEEAYDMVEKLSSLIRRFLNSSNKDELDLTNEEPHTIKDEIELLKLYIELEQYQYSNFDFNFESFNQLEKSQYVIPPFIVQPYVENAIKHGLNSKSLDYQGFLDIKVYKDEGAIFFQIEDNGIGVANSKAMQSQSIKKYKSLGTSITQKRVELLNEMGFLITIEAFDKEINGTLVKIKIINQNEKN